MKSSSLNRREHRRPSSLSSSSSSRRRQSRKDRSHRVDVHSISDNRSRRNAKERHDWDDTRHHQQRSESFVQTERTFDNDAAMRAQPRTSSRTSLRTSTRTTREPKEEFSEVPQDFDVCKRSTCRNAIASREPDLLTYYVKSPAAASGGYWVSYARKPSVCPLPPPRHHNYYPQDISRQRPYCDSYGSPSEDHQADWGPESVPDHLHNHPDRRRLKTPPPSLLSLEPLYRRPLQNRPPQGPVPVCIHPINHPCDHSPDHPHDYPTDHPYDHPPHHPPEHPYDHPPEHPHDHPPEHPYDHPPEHPYDHPPEYPYDYPPEHPYDYPPNHPCDHPHNYVHGHCHGYPHGYTHGYHHGYPHDYPRDHAHVHSRGRLRGPHRVLTCLPRDQRKTSEARHVRGHPVPSVPPAVCGDVRPPSRHAEPATLTVERRPAEVPLVVPSKKVRRRSSQPLPSGIEYAEVDFDTLDEENFHPRISRPTPAKPHGKGPRHMDGWLKPFRLLSQPSQKEEKHFAKDLVLQPVAVKKLGCVLVRGAGYDEHYERHPVMFKPADSDERRSLLPAEDGLREHKATAVDLQDSVKPVDLRECLLQRVDGLDKRRNLDLKQDLREALNNRKQEEDLRSTLKRKRSPTVIADAQGPLSPAAGAEEDLRCSLDKRLHLQPHSPLHSDDLMMSYRDDRVPVSSSDCERPEGDHSLLSVASAIKECLDDYDVMEVEDVSSVFDIVNTPDRPDYTFPPAARDFLALPVNMAMFPLRKRAMDFFETSFEKNQKELAQKSLPPSADVVPSTDCIAYDAEKSPPIMDTIEVFLMSIRRGLDCESQKSVRSNLKTSVMKRILRRGTKTSFYVLKLKKSILKRARKSWSSKTSILPVKKRECREDEEKNVTTVEVEKVASDEIDSDDEPLSRLHRRQCLSNSEKEPVE